MFEQAGMEPYQAINQANGVSPESYLSLLKEIERFILAFEEAIGMSGARTWIGERLHEAVHAGRATIERHLTNQYFSEFDISSDTAHLLIENYEMRKTRAMLLRSKFCAYDFTVLRFMVTRPVHEDAHSHIHKTDYSALFAKLVDHTSKQIEAQKPSERVKIKKLPLELTAPIYLKEREEMVARRMQRFALNAFLKRYYDRDPDRYGVLGVPLFVPPHPEVVTAIKRITKGNVDFGSGFLSTYRSILREYAGSIASSEAEIYEEARSYLQSRTDSLIALVHQCLEGDYTGLRTREREVVWRPYRGQKM